MGYSLRTEKYRYTIWMNDFTTTAPFSANKIYAQELYDLSKDPLEKMNVLNMKNYKKTAGQLYDKMIAFFKSQESK
jgi:hypothetical protein